MKKILGVAITATLMLGASVAHAADHYGFVNAGLGGASYRNACADGPGYTCDDGSLAASIRAGAAWRGAVDVGFEVGYAHLGDTVVRFDGNALHTRDTLTTKGWLLGANVAYRFDAPWYLQARGGWFRSTIDELYSYRATTTAEYRGSVSGNGWYAGVGGGYDVTEALSVGASYDNYRAVANVRGGRISGNVSTFTVQLAYRY